MPPPSMHGTVMTDEPPLRRRSAKLGRKHCSQDEANWATGRASLRPIWGGNGSVGGNNGGGNSVFFFLLEDWI
jgi:hypothetical protein